MSLVTSGSSTILYSNLHPIVPIRFYEFESEVGWRSKTNWNVHPTKPSGMSRKAKLGLAIKRPIGTPLKTSERAMFLYDGEPSGCTTFNHGSE